MSMTIKEAIRALHLPGDHIRNYDEYGIYIDDELKEAMQMAKTALRKQNPTTVTHEASIYACHTCPTCKNVVDETTEFIPGQKINVHPQWCKFCGQALKWEE